MSASKPTHTRIGLIGLAVMGQNLALNIAEKGFPISVFNRTVSKVDETVERAVREGQGKFELRGFHSLSEFVQSIQRPRSMIILVKAGSPVDDTIAQLAPLLEPGDLIIDGGNEWFENTERRAKQLQEKGLLYMGMGVSGGEEGARNGPSLMPGGQIEAFHMVEDILKKIAAQVEPDGPCVTYLGPRGAGNYVKMVHNGIEYGDMQLIAEAYDLLRNVGGLSNEELARVFSEWNAGELKSFLIEITADIFAKKDDRDPTGSSFLVDKVLDKAGSKGTGMWTVQNAAARGVPVPTMAAALDARYMSSFKSDRLAAARILSGPSSSSAAPLSAEERTALIEDVRRALYCSKVCSYAQGLHLLRVASEECGWDLNLGNISRIWKGGCIIRAVFLDRIKAAFDRNTKLPNLMFDDQFARELNERQESWRRVITLSIGRGVPVPAISASLGYYDSLRREVLPANLIQAQRDYFGAHTFERTDALGVPVHAEWAPAKAAAKSSH